MRYKAYYWMFLRIIFSLFIGMQLEARTPMFEKFGVIPLKIVIIGDASLKEVAEILAQDCAFTQQCSATVDFCKEKPSLSTLKSWAASFPLVLFINETKDKKSCEWRLYNSFGGQLIIGKLYHKKTDEPRVWAHGIADQLWPQLVCQKPLFSSRIAYCKEIKKNDRIIKKQICIADIDGKNEQVLVDAAMINTAPRFNHDLYNPLLFFSQHTKKNLRLMIIDQYKKQSIASDFDGINLLPAFNEKGDALVYCASRGDGTCHLYYYKPGQFKCLINNDGRNVSPSFGDDNTIYFCSDFKQENPQIYSYRLSKGTLEKISTDGYCTSPRFSNAAQKLVYSKMIQGTMQLMLYDPVTKQHEQITYNKGNKEEAAWSPCGNYILFSYEHNNTKRLALYNRITHKQRFITAANQLCSFPDWSPNYVNYPLFC